MEKHSTSLPAATVAADCGLFLHLGGWRPTELEQLKNGTGRWMRRIEAAIENSREDLAVGAANIVAVVLLYRHRGRGCSRHDAPKSIGSRGGMRVRIAPPIVVELGEIEGSEVEELLSGFGKTLEETREVMRLVRLNAAGEGTARIFVPIVASYVAPQHPLRLKKNSELGEGDASGGAERTLAIRYFRASRARIGGNCNRITIV
jgi:hypothetical protein